MDWVITPYALAMALVAIITATVGVAALKYRHTPGGLTIALLLFAIAEYALATGIEFAAIGVPAKIFWSKVEYLGLVYAPVLFLIFAMQYSHRDKWLTPRTITLLCIIPTITLLLAITNEWHHLIWTSFSPSPAGNNLIVYGHGIGIWMATGYYYLLMVIGAVVLIRTAIDYPSFYRLQAMIVLVAAVFPLVGNIVYMLDLSPAPGFDLTLISFAGTACLLALNIIFFRLFDLMPIARDALVENMSDAVLVVDAQNRIIDLNPAARQLFGRDLASLIGRDISQILPARRDIVEQYRAVQQTQTEITIAGNPPRYLDLRISPLRDWRSNPTGRLIVMRDITDLKKAQGQLRQLSVAVEQSPDTVVITDTAGNIEYVNPTFTRLTGYTFEEAIGKNPNILKSGRTTPEEYRRLWQTIKSGGEWRGEFQNKKKNGELYWESAVISAITDEQGNITHFLAIKEDITERKHAEREIQQHLAELTTINAISQVAAAQLELNAMIEAIGEKLRQILNVQSVYISLYDSEARMISTPYWRMRDQVIQMPSLSFGKGLSSRIIRTRQPLVINQDYAQRSAELGVVRIAVTPEIGIPKAWLGVPMQVGDQVIGIISAQNFEQENVFTENDVRLWTTIAANVGIAIRNAQLYGETIHYAEQMAALNRISLVITEGLDMEQLLPRIHEQCKQITPIDAFYVALYDESTHQRQVVYFYDRGQYVTTPPTDIRIAPGLTGYIIETRQTLYLPDSLDPNNPPPVPLIRTGGQPSRTFVGVPLILRDQVIGVISMQSYQPNAYTSQQIHMLEMIAVQAAIAIQNSQLYEEVQRLAITDELTGLPNRRVLFEKGENEVIRARRFEHPLSVMMIDIDHFKLVNDRFGHAVGDQVLRQIAQAFRQHLRNTDIAARYGGEEFVILLPETDQSLAIQVAERLRAAVVDCGASAGAEQVHVTVSLGVAVLDANTPNFSKLVSHADQALYLAKDRGRNRVMIWDGESP